MIVGNTPAAFAAKAATTTVPIVFATGNDPVTDRLVVRLNRQHTVRYTELAPDRFKNFWRD